MPCYSTVTRTQMMDAERLADAMRLAGVQDVEVGPNHVGGDGVLYQRNRPGDAFSTRDSGPTLDNVGKRYAAASVRAWAKRANYSIVESDGEKMRLKNRRS